MSDSFWLDYLPRLNSHNHRITSPPTVDYNCIAWAAGETHRWWWPIKPRFWPQGAPRAETLEAFTAAFKTLGYEQCDDDSLEKGYEKIALFAQNDGDSLTPTHAARQLPNGRWTSKLGTQEDIEHEQARDVESECYGAIALFMKRQSKSKR